MSTPPSLPPRGWYPDPAGTAAWRWWDGERWTDNLEPFQQPTILSVGPSRALLDHEQHDARVLMRVGVTLLGASVILGLLTASISANDSAALIHWFGQVLSAARAHQPAPVAPAATAPGWVSAMTLLLVTPARILGAIMLLRFQYRAAKVARSRGLPQRLSPALGVWGWFIPFANFVLPLQAWQDLVGEDHPERSRMLGVWLLIVANGLLSGLGFVATVWSTTLARALFVASALCALAALWAAPMIIEAIVAAHRTDGLADEAAVRGDASGI